MTAKVSPESASTQVLSIQACVRRRSARASAGAGESVSVMRLSLGEWKDIFGQEDFWSAYLREACRGILDDRGSFLNHFSELVNLRNVCAHGGALTEYQARASEFFLTEFEEIVSRMSKNLSPGSVQTPANPVCWLTPVRSDEEGTAVDTILRLVGQKGIYAFGDKTPGRKRMKPGDAICFYATGFGVVGHARLASKPERTPNESVRHPQQYPWTVSLIDQKLYTDNPVVIDATLRLQLESFRGRPEKKDWAWFVQTTHKLSQHDFEILTGETTQSS